MEIQAQTNLEIEPASLYSLLLTLTWGVGHTARYCRWNENLIVNGLTYTAEPSLKMSENQQHGGTEDAPLSITLRDSKTTFNALSLMQPHAKVKATIAFVRVGDDSTEQEYFYGTISKTTTAPNGQAGLIKCEISGIKARLKTIMGMEATSTCQSAFLGDAMCKILTEYLQIDCNVTSISTSEPNVVITDAAVGMGDPADELANLKWKFGSIKVDGLSISIRASRLDGSFELREMVPTSWIGQPATLFRGCDRQISTCRDVYDNEENFSGFGFAMPDYNPLLQTR
mgnify:CR=1 FL=1